MKYASPEVSGAVLTSSRIKQQDLLIATTTTFALAFLSTSARVALKLRQGSPFALDDYFIFLGAVCLAVGTGVFLAGLDNFYFLTGASVNRSIGEKITPSEFRQLSRVNAAAYVYAATALLWSATFCIKFSFLAFFNGIVKSLEPSRGLRRYYISAIVTTALSFAYVIACPFLGCPHFDDDANKCFAPDFRMIFKVLSLLGTALDILTDVLIISIPIIVLQHIRISIRQKLALGAFLSLSLGMILIAAVRSLKFPGPLPVTYDTPWLLFWVYLEAAVAVVMGSLTAFRTVFTAKCGATKKQQAGRCRQPSTWGVIVRWPRPRDVEGGAGRGKTAMKVPKEEKPTRMLSGEREGEDLKRGEAARAGGAPSPQGTGEFPWVTAPEWVGYGLRRATQ